MIAELEKKNLKINYSSKALTTANISQYNVQNWKKRHLLSCLSAGENLTMVFTLKDWGAQSRTFNVRNSPTPEPYTSSAYPPFLVSLETSSKSIVPVTTSKPSATTDNSIFGSSSILSTGFLCLIGVICSVAFNSI